MPQAPATAFGLLYFSLGLAATAITDRLAGIDVINFADKARASFTAQEIWSAVAHYEQLYVALATALTWFCSYPTAAVRQVVDRSHDSVRSIAEALHVAVQQASKVQADTLNTAEDTEAATGLAASAVALLSFAESDCRGDGGPDDRSALLPSDMHIAATATSFLRRLAQLLQAGGVTAACSRSVLASQGAAAALRRLLSWLAEPTTAVAMSPAVLAEALPALAALADGYDEARQQLGARGGPHEWAPVAAALKRRLPRRMAARFLIEVDCVTTAVAKAGSLTSTFGALHM